jgi:hypothetical protein
MRIPEVRRKLSAAADDLRMGARKPVAIARELDTLASELWRRSPRRNASKATRTKMTPELRREILEFAKKNKTLDQQAIANEFNVNAGRVSEIMSGLRR